MSWYPAQPTIERLLLLAIRLGRGLPITAAFIQQTHGVSYATAKRDMVRLESMLPVFVEELPIGRERGGFPQKEMRLMRGSELFRLMSAEAD